MRECLTYYYLKGTEPFRSLSALSYDEAIRIMETMYAEFTDSILFERFKDPVGYWNDRRKAENWVCDAFIAKGGTPQEAYPITTEKPEPYYLPDYHGKVFTRSEILTIVEERGFPEESWDIQLPDNVGAYIEAQVWNHAVLRTYKRLVVTP